MKYRFFNKLNIIIFIFMFVIIVISFFSYMYPRYSKENELLYESIEKNCKKEYKKEICKEYGISNSESYENFMQYDPRVRKGELDLIILSQEVIKNELFSLIDIIIPLIISIIVVLTISVDIYSGLYKNILLRMTYKEYILHKLKNIMLISNIIPLFILIINFIAGIITDFNLNIQPYYHNLYVYDSFIENNYILYLIFTYILTYLGCLLFGLISFICSIKEKSKIVAIVKSYLICVIVTFIDYYIVNQICLNIFKLKINVGTFNIISYYKFGEDINFIAALINILILISIISIYFVKNYNRKDKLYGQIEKQNSNI